MTAPALSMAEAAERLGVTEDELRRMFERFVEDDLRMQACIAAHPAGKAVAS